jgi:hypothetical protein
MSLSVPSATYQSIPLLILDRLTPASTLQPPAPLYTQTPSVGYQTTGSTVGPLPGSYVQNTALGQMYVQNGAPQNEVYQHTVAPSQIVTSSAVPVTNSIRTVK